MPSAVKARIKVDAVEGVLSSIDEAIRSASGNETALRASADTLNQLLERFHGYRGKVDEALEDGTFPPQSREAVLAVFGDLVRITDQMRSHLDRSAREQRPFLAGLAKARSIALHRKDSEERIATRAEVDEQEEQEHREDRTERTQKRPQRTPEGSRGVKVVPIVSRTPANVPEVPEDVPRCSHCQDPITVPTGEDHCVPCVSHRNRYRSLPSPKVLEKRRVARASDS